MQCRRQMRWNHTTDIYNSKAEFDAAIAQDKLVVLDMHATWCGMFFLPRLLMTVFDVVPGSVGCSPLA